MRKVLMFGLLCLICILTAYPADKEQTVTLKPKKLDFIPLCAAQVTPLLEITDNIKIGEHTFAVELQKDNKEIKIALKPDVKPSKMITKPDTVVELELPKGTVGKYSIILKQTDKGWVYLRASGVSGKICEEELVFVDENTNGVFNELGIDGIIYSGCRYVIPLEEEIVVRRSVVKIKVSADGTSATYTATVMKEREDYLKGLELINQIRVSAGLPPRPINPQLCRDCELHAKYLQLNPDEAHDETPGKPGYTKEGQRAGKNSCIGVNQDIDRAIRCFMDSFWHRLPFTRPETKAYGLGEDKLISLVDYRSNSAEVSWALPILFPAPEQDNVGVSRFLPEHPKVNSSATGFCITIDFLNSSSVKLVEAKIICQGTKLELPKPGKGPLPAGEEIKFDAFWPGKSASPDAFPNNDSVIVLIPEKPLKSNSVYWVWARYTDQDQPAERTWWFRTAKGQVWKK